MEETAIMSLKTICFDLESLKRNNLCFIQSSLHVSALQSLSSGTKGGGGLNEI